MNMLPNIITSIRIIGAISLIFTEPLTLAFFVVYTLSGVSDVLDGWVARKFGAITKLGTVLDSIADILFYTVMLLKISPVLFEMLPGGIWIAVAIIILIRIASYIIAAIKYRRFASLHTYLNKLTGLAMFSVPYFISLPFGDYFCFAVCSIAGISSLEELLIHIKSKQYNEKTKSLLSNA